MAIQAIVADAQPFVNSELPIRLKAVVAKRIKVAAPSSYQAYLQKLDNLVANLENLGVFTSERSLNYALKEAKTVQGELNNQELIKLLFEQQRLQKIFAKIKQEGSFNNLERTELEYLLQHPAEDVRAFVNKYQQELDQSLELRFSDEIDPYLLRTLTAN
jgi:hypothetical protein